MTTELVKRRNSSYLTRPDQRNEDFIVSSDNLEMLLEEDGTFVEFFNAFLALPMFPIRLYYNPDIEYFEEFKQQLADNFVDDDAKKATSLQKYSFFKNTIDNKGLKIGYYVKFLSKNDGFDWVKKNRLPLFVKSELCAEYKLARVLSFDQTLFLMNILIDSRNLEKNAFDERSSPQYRTQRTRGKLPGLAEFQERMQLLEASEKQSCASSSGSESDDIEFSQIYSRQRRNRHNSSFRDDKSLKNSKFSDDDKQSVLDANDDQLCESKTPMKRAESTYSSVSCTKDYNPINDSTEIERKKLNSSIINNQVTNAPAGEGNDVATANDQVDIVATDEVYDAATAKEQVDDVTTGAANNSATAKDRRNDASTASASTDQLICRATSLSGLRNDASVPKDDSSMSIRQAVDAATENDKADIIVATDERIGAVTDDNLTVNTGSEVGEKFHFKDAGMFSVIGVLKKTYKEAIGMPELELLSTDKNNNTEKCRVCNHNSVSPDRFESKMLSDGDVKDGLNSTKQIDMIMKTDVNAEKIVNNNNENDDKGSTGQVIQDGLCDNQCSRNSNFDKDIKKACENQLILNSGMNRNSNEYENNAKKITNRDIPTPFVNDPSLKEERLDFDEKLEKNSNSDDINCPSVVINIPDDEKTRTEEVTENKNLEDFETTRNDEVIEEQKDNHLLKHDSNSSLKLQAGRRCSDWSAIANEIDDSDDHLLRRRSMPALNRDLIQRRLSSLSVASDALEAINDLIADDMDDLRRQKSRAAISVLYEESDSEDDSDIDESGKIAKKPIDVASKSGMDAFKYFLVNTPGEKLFLLWVEIERLKYSSDKEKLRIIQEIRQRFFRSGSTYEINTETLKKWNINNISEIGFKTLIEIHDKVLEPLRVYWCARFTVHQKRKHKSFTNDYISQDHSCMKSKCSTHQVEMTRVPQRPNTCFPHFRVQSSNLSKGRDARTTSSKISASEVYDRLSMQNDVMQPHSDGESGRTKARIRSKSAYPRLINTSNPKDINLCQKQLQLITTLDEGCGYSSIPNKSYRNDASNPDYKSNIRLFIQPIPPANCKASTIVKSNNSHQEQSKDHTKILLDSLVECLLHEKHSGNFFYCYLEKCCNQLWLNCYQFWKLLQDYSEHFFTDKFSPGLIKQKAGFLYSNFIVNGSRQSINCDVELQKEVFKKLDPAYEELFDKVEEHALKILSEAFKLIFDEESTNYNELTKNEKLRYLDVRTRLRRPKHQPEEKEEEKETEKEDYREKISIEEVNTPLPVSSDGVTFDSFIRNKVEVESFKEFLERANNKGLKDLLAWTEMENFRRSSHRHNQRNTIAKSVGENWLTNDYFFGPVSPATKEAQEKVRNMTSDSQLLERPPSPVILEAQKYVRARIERRWFVMFKETNTYQKRHKTANVTEMVEDMIMKRRLQRSEAAWKILNSRWVSGSRDVVALRQVLMNSTKCLQFRKFLSLKGELMERNVHFWLEVQKYKELCHRHVEDSIIKNKIQAIIDVFIKSSIPPDLQIDVPIEIAERLHEKACARAPQHGPYLFREAQTTVFRIMFNHWKEFITFRASIEEEKLGQHLEELDKKHKAQVRARKMIAERKRLAKAAYDKRRKEREEQERQKERQKVLANAGSVSSMAYDNATSLISEDEEITMQTKSFTFSKFTVEQELQTLEQRMREEGCTLEEFTEGDFTQSYYTSDRKTMRKFSSHLSDDQRSISGLSFKRGRRTSDIFSKITRKESIIHEPIFENTEQLFNRRESKRNEEENQKSKLSVASLKVMKANTEAKQEQNKQTNLNTTTRKINLSLNRKRMDDSISVGKMSSVTDLGMNNRAKNISLMPGPQRKMSNSGSVLTTQSLREFNRSPQGKPLAVPLPLIHVTNSTNKESTVQKDPVICSVAGKSKSNPVRKTKQRYPRTQKTKLKIESTSETTTSGIVADIVVC